MPRVKVKTGWQEKIDAASHLRKLELEREQTLLNTKAIQAAGTRKEKLLKTMELATAKTSSSKPAPSGLSDMMSSLDDVLESVEKEREKTKALALEKSRSSKGTRASLPLHSAVSLHATYATTGRVDPLAALRKHIATTLDTSEKGPQDKKPKNKSTKNTR